MVMIKTEKMNGKIYVSPFAHEIFTINPLKQKTRLPLGSNCNCKPMNGANSPKPLFGLQTANRHFR
jgi:hypothetical protein